MKTYIFKHSLLGVIVGLSILGCTEGDKFDYNKNVAFITGTETTPVTKFVVEDTPSSYAITASTTDKVDKDVNVKFAIDRSLVESYNQEHNTKYYAIPKMPMPGFRQAKPSLHRLQSRLLLRKILPKGVYMSFLSL